jgi:hypothetical protein
MGNGRLMSRLLLPRARIFAERVWLRKSKQIIIIMHVQFWTSVTLEGQHHHHHHSILSELAKRAKQREEANHNSRVHIHITSQLSEKQKNKQQQKLASHNPTNLFPSPRIPHFRSSKGIVSRSSTDNKNAHTHKRRDQNTNGWWWLPKPRAHAMRYYGILQQHGKRE